MLVYFVSLFYNRREFGVLRYLNGPLLLFLRIIMLKLENGPKIIIIQNTIRTTQLNTYMTWGLNKKKKYTTKYLFN